MGRLPAVPMWVCLIDRDLDNFSIGERAVIDQVLNQSGMPGLNRIDLSGQWQYSSFLISQPAPLYADTPKYSKVLADFRTLSRQEKFISEKLKLQVRDRAPTQCGHEEFATGELMVTDVLEEGHFPFIHARAIVVQDLDVNCCFQLLEWMCII